MKNHSPLRDPKAVYDDTYRARNKKYADANKQNAKVEKFLEDLGNNELKSSVKKSNEYMPLREKSPD